MPTPLTYTAADVRGRLNGPYGTVRIELEAGQTAWNPATTKPHPITGPAAVTYRFHADGGIDTKVH